MIKVKVTGIEKTISNLGKIEKNLVDISYNKALQDLGEKIGEISASKVPVDEGILKSTFTVQKIGNSWICGYNTEYAAYQHQGMRKDGTAIIRNRPGGGESFFLSSPVQTNRNQLLQFMQQRFKHYLQKSL